MAVKIKGTFKADARQFNGLESVAEELIEEPLTRRVVVGTIEASRITRDIEDGDSESVTVRFVQIEPLDGEHAVDARKFLDEAYAKRNGGGGVQGDLFDAGEG